MSHSGDDEKEEQKKENRGADLLVLLTTGKCRLAQLPISSILQASSDSDAEKEKKKADLLRPACHVSQSHCATFFGGQLRQRQRERGQEESGSCRAESELPTLLASFNDRTT